ncbi:hypothetical protein Hypma_005605 [Hypsizygus marmoreus]|uniref:Uncharacterized protein n=1 Tax=Hypsizygus marmoreus TaxID=39966 RepID=A0A369K6J4_HYPMA|nr:hypothetical protein Hypma_005605 [Hypsizygus marmoreus]
MESLDLHCSRPFRFSVVCPCFHTFSPGGSGFLSNSQHSLSIIIPLDFGACRLSTTAISIEGLWRTFIQVRTFVASRRAL